MRGRKTTLGLACLLAGLTWSLVAPSLAQNDRIHWVSSYREAVEEARKTHKPIFLEFRCEP